jgi:hypothetical protein
MARHGEASYLLHIIHLLKEKGKVLLVQHFSLNGASKCSVLRHGETPADEAYLAANRTPNRAMITNGSITVHEP